MKATVRFIFIGAILAMSVLLARADMVTNELKLTLITRSDGWLPGEPTENEKFMGDPTMPMTYLPNDYNPEMGWKGLLNYNPGTYIVAYPLRFTAAYDKADILPGKTLNLAVGLHTVKGGGKFNLTAGFQAMLEFGERFPTGFNEETSKIEWSDWKKLLPLGLDFYFDLESDPAKKPFPPSDRFGEDFRVWDEIEGIKLPLPESAVGFAAEILAEVVGNVTGTSFSVTNTVVLSDFRIDVGKVELMTPSGRTGLFIGQREWQGFPQAICT